MVLRPVASWVAGLVRVVWGLGGCGGDRYLEAEGLELADVAADFLVAAGLALVPVGAEVGVAGGGVVQQVPDDDED
jgi:hypothetical protein